MTEENYPTWAIAAVALFGRHTSPLFIRTFTSPRDVLEHPEGATCANLYVGEEDVVRLHFLLFSSLDRCEDIVQERLQQQQQHQSDSNSPRVSSMTPGAAVRVSSGADVRFLGRLMRNHKFTSYGFRSATGIQTILAIVGDIPLDAVLPLCRTTYEAASAALCNPFRMPRIHTRMLQRWCGVGAQEMTTLPAAYEENLQAAPTPETTTEEPSLAYSHSFREQIRKIIEPFTATTLSHMV